MSHRPHLIEAFMDLTNASSSEAEQFLDKNGDDFSAAVEDFYQSREDPGRASGASTPSAQRSSTRKAPSGGVRTLRDLGDDSDDQDKKTADNLFTGGEKSALQVENPDKDAHGRRSQPSLIEKIFQRAQQQMEEPDDRPSAMEPDISTASHFTGTGFRLGDSESPSQAIPNTTTQARRPSKVSREITFWRQGFTVGEGVLRRYDDPENMSLLSELKQGRVPVSLLDVEFGQDVDVSVVRKVDEDYVPPKRKLGGFHGSGQRLGSPVPGESTASPEPVQETAEKKPKPADMGQGDSLVQIRFANGKRVSHKFNGSDTMAVVYDFVRHHENNDSQREFLLSHTFPVKPIEESEEETVESAKLKNAVIVQRWK